MIYTEKPEDFNPTMEVASCIMDCKGKLLLLLRQDHKPEGNTWCQPAGKVEANESALETVAREIAEETGYKAEPARYTFSQTYYVKYPERDFVYHVFHLKLDTEPAIILETSAHKDYRWVTPKEALQLPLIPDEDRCIKDFYQI